MYGGNNFELIAGCPPETVFQQAAGDHGRCERASMRVSSVIPIADEIEPQVQACFEAALVVERQHETEKSIGMDVTASRNRLRQTIIDTEALEKLPRSRCNPSANIRRRLQGT
jgi:hypothetical protein